MSEIKQKSLPAIAKAVGLDNQQNLRHFLVDHPTPNLLQLAQALVRRFSDCATARWF